MKNVSNSNGKDGKIAIYLLINYKILYNIYKINYENLIENIKLLLNKMCDF